MNAQELIDILNEKDVIKILDELGCLDYKEFSEGYVFKSICHDSNSYKLHYYISSKRFYCFRCGKQWNIYDLIMKVKGCNFRDAFIMVNDIVNNANRPMIGFYGESKENTSLDDIEIERLPKINKQYLYNIFKNIPIKEWLEEGISEYAMNKFDIRYDTKENQVIIPHRDMDGNVVGIRVRNMDKVKLAKGKPKYVPLWYDGKCYSHSLSKNLYGLNVSMNNINKNKICVVFEAEKSVLKYETCYPSNNISVAMCGSVLSMQSKKILLDLGVEEICLCMDKEFTEYGDEECIEYEQKIIKQFNGLEGKCKCSYVIDTDGLLNKKDSPIDKSKEIFEKLIKQRKFIRE